MLVDLFVAPLVAHMVQLPDLKVTLCKIDRAAEAFRKITLKPNQQRRLKDHGCLML
jgi:hypothetical protein